MDFINRLTGVKPAQKPAEDSGRWEQAGNSTPTDDTSQTLQISLPLQTRNLSSNHHLRLIALQPTLRQLRSVVKSHTQNGTEYGNAPSRPISMPR